MDTSYKFVCLATKAIHLEAVSDLSTQAFIAAFRRFSGRRGLCSHIYSDCGTNFVGAAKKLKGMAIEWAQYLDTNIIDTLLHQAELNGISSQLDPHILRVFGKPV